MKRWAAFCLMLQLIFELSSCEHIQLLEGSSLNLPCSPFSTESTTATIIWKFNGNDISAQATGSVQVKKDGLYLVISPVSAVHQGMYLCLVQENNMKQTRTYHIRVLASADYDITISEGSTLHLPCHFPPSSQVDANALWFKGTGSGPRTRLGDENISVDGIMRVELLYPLDQDQTIIIRNTVMEDAGIYHCETAGGEKLSSVNVTVTVAPTPVPHTCTGFQTPWEPCQDESSHIGELVLQESMAELSMKLYSYLRESNPSGNLLFSPISISTALSYLLLGARGTTRKSIQTAVSVPHHFHCVHLHMKKLREKLASSLQMASQIYYNPQINVSQSFKNQSMQFYEAEPIKLQENSEENTRMINSWVAHKTNDKITHLVDIVSPNAQLILLNAVSFSGQWVVKFAQKPRKGHFTKLDGDLVTVPLLYHEHYLVPIENIVQLKAEVVKFALTGNSSLYVVLPNSHTAADLRQVEERMKDSAVLQMINQMKAASPKSVEVTLPQIKLRAQPNMNILLKKLGLSSLFEDPNLCGLFPEDQVVLDDSRHKAFLALNEHGVEAAAATSFSYSRSHLSFSALRPFVLLLWNDEANVPLFVGRVTDP